MLPVNSRFRRSVAILVQDANGVPTRRMYLDLWPRFRRVEFEDDAIYRLQDGDTLHKLAHRYLGDSNLWWIIAEVNRLVDPWADFAALLATNETIRIPSRSRVAFDHLNFTKNRLEF